MKRCVWIACATVVAATCGAWAVEPAPASQKGKPAEEARLAAALVGKWKIVVQRHNGEEVDLSETPETEFTLQADRALIVQGFKLDGALRTTLRGKYELDLAASPPRLRFLVKPAPDAAETAYEWHPFALREEGEVLSLLQFPPADEADESAPVPPANVEEYLLERLPAE